MASFPYNAIRGFSYQDMFLQILKKTSIDKHLNAFITYDEQAYWYYIVILVIAAVASASTLVSQYSEI